MYLYKKVLVLSLLMMCFGWGNLDNDDGTQNEPNNIINYEFDNSYINSQTQRDLEEAVIINSYNIPNHAMGLVFYNGYLWMVTAESNQLYKLNPLNGEIDLISNLEYAPKGITIWEENFIISDFS